MNPDDTARPVDPNPRVMAALALVSPSIIRAAAAARLQEEYRARWSDRQPTGRVTRPAETRSRVNGLPGRRSRAWRRLVVRAPVRSPRQT